MKINTINCLALITVVFTLAACAPMAEDQTTVAIEPFATEAPAGAYHVDPSHADLSFRVNHLGFSWYTARFTNFSADLHFDPLKPAEMNVVATIDPRSLVLPSPPEDFLDTLLGPNGWMRLSFQRLDSVRRGLSPRGKTRCGLLGI